MTYTKTSIAALFATAFLCLGCGDRGGTDNTGQADDTGMSDTAPGTAGDAGSTGTTGAGDATTGGATGEYGGDTTADGQAGSAPVAWKATWVARPIHRKAQPPRAKTRTVARLRSSS